MIDEIKVVGGKELSGEIVVQGAKNEALQVICAALLTEEDVIIERVPNILDVERLLSAIEFLGAKVEKISEDSFKINSKDVDIKKLETPEFRQKVSQTRGALMISGPLLARFGVATMSRPGGDNIGIRPVDVHLAGFESLGAKIDDKDDKFRRINLDAVESKDFYLYEISVTGTANVLMASLLSRGESKRILIRNAASEPYIVGLCNMLNSMGAKIGGIGTNTLVVDTVASLSGTKHKLSPDFIEAGSLIGLAVCTNSEILLKDVSIADLGFMIPYTYELLGIKIQEKDGGIFIPKQSGYKISKLRDGHIREIYDAPWPGLTPDLLSIFVVVAVQSEGVLKIHQKMFEKRLFFVDKLQDMGAQIEVCDPHRVIVIGLNNSHRLRGLKMASPDIRAGMALLIAALSAEGTSVIENASQITRGYSNIFERLKSLGAEIEVIK